jgi:uncharacterized protein (DUF2141 family)
MKNIINLFTLILICSFKINAQDSIIASNASLTSEVESCTLTIEMTNLDSDKGQIMIAVYKTKDDWLNKSFKSLLSTIENGKAVVVFTGIPYGIYAASAVHDQDMDGKLKTGLLGIPSEPYASSRGAKGMFGPPKWEDAKFTLDTNNSIENIKF